MNTVFRSAKNVPVWKKFDVVVAGGGFSGVAAALAAARNGAKVCLVDKASSLGGLGTVGHVVIYLPLCDGRGRQVSFGIAEELLRLPMKYSSCRPNGAWALPDPLKASRAERSAKRFELVYDPGPMIIGMERLLQDSGVELVYDSLIVDVIRDSDGGITHLILENKSGCGAFEAGNVIDCTGDADICTMCGEAIEVARRNHAGAWYYSVNSDRVVQLQCGSVHPYSSDDEIKYPFFDGIDYESVTKHITYSRKLILEDLEYLNCKQREKGAEPLHVFTVPHMACFRMTRRLVGQCTMTESDVHKWHDDAVGVFSDWRKAGPVYSLPWRALAAVKTPNLAAAGRCMSATGDTWDVTRVIPVCSVTGEAAGTAAALTAKSGKRIADVKIDAVQATLVAHGVKLDPALVEEIPEEK